MSALLRIFLMVLAVAPIFTGFGMPFFMPHWPGFALGIGLVVAGSWLLWFVHRRTRRWLDPDTALNRMLKANGEFVLHNPTDRDPRLEQEDESRRD